jgi:hypothetical protein
MKPSSSHAEPLRRQQTSQVRASNRFLVAADEVGDLERRQQSIRERRSWAERRPQGVRRPQYAPDPGTRVSA